jgi:hypothetical protein
VTIERSLAKVEATLRPKELVLRWLAEAHAHDDFTAHARATQQVGLEAMPLDRIVHQTIDWVEARSIVANRTSRHSAWLTVSVRLRWALPWLGGKSEDGAPVEQ